jgi:hypothetical protein
VSCQFDGFASGTGNKKGPFNGLIVVFRYSSSKAVMFLTTSGNKLAKLFFSYGSAKNK